ncbi:hypothetical protein MMC30_005118 [Trapelia coarctata]|nr:hypothetical protein [Trapelia coarctata]
MANQLRCFSLINTEWEHPFNGTVIRIPLRNTSQEKRSEISTKEASIRDVRYSMDSFANEMGSNGLLFLRSVQRIVLSVDDQRLNEVEIVNRHDLIEPKERLKGVLDGVMNHGDLNGGETYHEVSLRHWAATRETVKTFGVLNFVAGSVHDASLAKWAASEKLFPWVAVAAPLVDHDRNWELGSLFSVLPLPILTGLPVHIHGLFSVSADRSRLHGLDDRGVQDDRPESWNKFLFGQIIPRAWANLLVNVCQNRQRQDLFHLWPTATSEAHQWWYGMSHAVMDIVSRNNDSVWFTELGYVSIKDGLLASTATNISYLKKLVRPPEVEICVLKRFMKIFEKLAAPSAYRADQTALEIFPFEDGTFRSLTSLPVFLHRDVFDKKLFVKQPGSNIDTHRVSETTLSWLHEQVKDSNSIVRYRTPTDLRDYFLSYIANGSSDTLVFGEEQRSILSKVWEWIIQHCQEGLPLSALGPLWLVPLRDSVVRKLIPLDVSNSATWFDTGKGEEIALKIIAIDPSNAPKLIANDALSDVALRCLLSFTGTERSLHLKDGKKFGDFLNFLEEGRSLLQRASEDVKDSVFCLVKELYWVRHGFDLDIDTDILRSLCIFKEIQWPIDAVGSSMMTRSSTDLTRNIVFVGIRKLVPLPSSLSQVFLDATDERACSLFEDLDLVKCLDEIQILEELVIPALQNGSYEHMASNLRLDVTELLFQNYFRLSASARGCISSLSVVPLEHGEEDKRLSFGCPVDIIDPQESALASLYFEDEMTRPERHFYNRFSGVLVSCGMMTRLNGHLVLDRIRSYETKQLPFRVVASRAKTLLQLPLCEDISRPHEFAQSVRSCAWLPAQSPERSGSLTSSLECRDGDDQPIVGRVWRTLPFRVEHSWRSILGWQDRIHAGVLISQLERSINASDIHSIEQTLFYLDRHYAFEDYMERLSGLNFILSSHELFISPAQACREGAERLMPYLYNVDSRFWNEHIAILRHANVPEMPDLGRLHDVQAALELKGALGKMDLEVALEIAHIWGSQSDKSFGNLKVPDNTGLLVDVDSLIFNDMPWLSEVNHAVAQRERRSLPQAQFEEANGFKLAHPVCRGSTDPYECHLLILARVR